jgi:hypothetical protein
VCAASREMTSQSASREISLSASREKSESARECYVARVMPAERYEMRHRCVRALRVCCEQSFFFFFLQKKHLTTQHGTCEQTKFRVGFRV